MSYRLLFVFALLLPNLAAARVVPLAEVLRSAEAEGGGGSAAAELEARYAAKEQREHEAGWQVFGSANVGRYHELVTEDLRNDYYGRTYAIGLRYPLLGSLRRQAEAVQTANREAERARIDQGLQRAQRRLALRSAYADWWRAQQEDDLCRDSTAAARSAERQVQQRLRQQWILPSDAEVMRSEWTAVRRRCDLQRDVLADTRASLASLGVTIEANDRAQAVPLAVHPANLATWQALLDEHPRLAGRRLDVRAAEAGRDRPWYTAITSDFVLAQSLEERSGASDRGSGLSAGVTVSAPFDLLGYNDARRREGAARYRAADRAMENERGVLLRELGLVLERQRRALDEYVWRHERRQALDLILTERRQRTTVDVGEASLRLLQAEVDHYNAGFAMISAWHGAWIEESALHLFGDDSPAFAGLLGKTLPWSGVEQRAAPASVAPDWNVATYVWDSAALLDDRQRASQLARLKAVGISTVYLGLNAVQLAAGPATHTALARLLQDARDGGLSVKLLLGDPDWITPSRRHELVDLIERLRDLPFAGLHLDLEVEQLGWPVPDQRLHDWLATLEAAKAASPWPLGLSSHPRWFDEQAQRRPCLPCGLAELQPEAVSLMIYSRNPQRSIDRAIAIAKRWPKLSFRLAQSLEPDLPATESWADTAAADLRRQVEAWTPRLKAASLGGIDWQSWTYYPSTP